MDKLYFNFMRLIMPAVSNSICKGYILMYQVNLLFPGSQLPVHFNIQLDLKVRYNIKSTSATSYLNCQVD